MIIDNTITQLLELTRTRLLQLSLLNPQWHKQYDKHGWLVHTQVNPDNEININRVEFEAQVPKQKLLSYFMDFTKRAEIDKDFQAKLIKNIDDDTAIFYGKDKPSMFMVGPRDFIIVRRREELPDGVTVVFNRSIDHHEIPVPKGVERADVIFQAWFLKETGPHSVHMLAIGHVDPKGNIPKAVVNKSWEGMLENLQSIVAYIAKH